MPQTLQAAILRAKEGRESKYTIAACLKQAMTLDETQNFYWSTSRVTTSLKRHVEVIDFSSKKQHNLFGYWHCFLVFGHLSRIIVFACGHKSNSAPYQHMERHVSWPVAYKDRVCRWRVDATPALTQRATNMSLPYRPFSTWLIIARLVAAPAGKTPSFPHLDWPAKQQATHWGFRSASASHGLWVSHLHTHDMRPSQCLGMDLGCEPQLCYPEIFACSNAFKTICVQTPDALLSNFWRKSPLTVLCTLVQSLNAPQMLALQGNCGRRCLECCCYYHSRQAHSSWSRGAFYRLQGTQND